jgi:putative FmdB family regulatory protein
MMPRVALPYAADDPAQMKAVSMPAYDFKCTKCGTVTEVRRPSSEDIPVPCPECGSATKQVFHPVGVHFKGSGFHNTDNRKPAPPEVPPACPAADGGSCAGCPSAE